MGGVECARWTGDQTKRAALLHEPLPDLTQSPPCWAVDAEVGQQPQPVRTDVTPEPSMFEGHSPGEATQPQTACDRSFHGVQCARGRSCWRLPGNRIEVAGGLVQTTRGRKAAWRPYRLIPIMDENQGEAPREER